LTFVNVMLDADAVINNSSQKVGGSNAYPDPAPKRWVGPDPEKHIGSTPLIASRIVSYVYGRTQLVDCREVANKRVATDVKRQQQHQQQHQLVSF